MHTLGIDVRYSTSSVHWTDQGEIPMKNNVSEWENLFYIEDPKELVVEADKMSTILDAKYKKANLREVVESTYHLTSTEKTQLEKLLRKYEPLFDGTIGTWNMDKYHVALREGATPYHGRPFQIPKAYERQLKAEVERLVKIGILKKINHSQWAAPCFVIPKKDKTIRFISDFRELNKRIKRTPFPLPKI